jgi:hypothetical protein
MILAEQEEGKGRRKKDEIRNSRNQKQIFQHV